MESGIAYAGFCVRLHTSGLDERHRHVATRSGVIGVPQSREHQGSLRACVLGQWSRLFGDDPEASRTRSNHHPRFSHGVRTSKLASHRPPSSSTRP